MPRAEAGGLRVVLLGERRRSTLGVRRCLGCGVRCRARSREVWHGEGDL